MSWFRRRRSRAIPPEEHYLLDWVRTLRATPTDPTLLTSRDRRDARDAEER